MSLLGSSAPADATARVADAYGSSSDIHAYCNVLTNAVASEQPAQPHALRHVVIAGDFAVATVRIGFDSFNVMSRRMGSGWSEPYSVGPLYPRIETLIDRGIPRPVAAEIFAQLQRLDAVAPSQRRQPCR